MLFRQKIFLSLTSSIFGNECAAPCGPVVNTADADGKAIGRWSDGKVGADTNAIRG